MRVTEGDVESVSETKDLVQELQQTAEDRETPTFDPEKLDTLLVQLDGLEQALGMIVQHGNGTVGETTDD
jgi:hypothetical protein